jgi:PAS domain-containing protein
VEAAQKPLELILARNFLSSLSTPAILVGAGGEIIFYNEAAGIVLGRRFEEAGKIPADVWTRTFGPFDDAGEPIPYDQLSLTGALRGNRPAHASFHIRSATGVRHEVEASGVPIVGSGGFSGAIVVFWPVDSPPGSA